MKSLSRLPKWDLLVLLFVVRTEVINRAVASKAADKCGVQLNLNQTLICIKGKDRAGNMMSTFFQELKSSHVNQCSLA